MWGQGPGDPGPDVCPLVGRARAWGFSLQILGVPNHVYCSAGGQCSGPACLRAGASLMVGELDPAIAGCVSAVVLGLLSTHWLVRLVLRPEPAHWWVGPSPRGFWGLCLPTGGWTCVLVSLAAGPCVPWVSCLHSDMWGQVLSHLVDRAMSSGGCCFRKS